MHFSAKLLLRVTSFWSARVHLPQVHVLPQLPGLAAQLGQLLELLGHPAQTFRLPPDIVDEFPYGGFVHAVVLHDAVGQQGDGRQGCFQLVRGVGHEALADPFDLLQPVRQEVYLPADLPQLVQAAVGDAGVVAPCADAPDTRQDHAGAPGDEITQEKADQQGQDGRDQGDGKQIKAQAIDQGCLRRIVFIQEDRADDAAAAHDRDAGAAGDRTGLQLGEKHVVALQRQLHLPFGGRRFLAGYLLDRVVIDDPPVPVRDEDPAEALVVHQRHDLAHLLRPEHIQGGERGSIQGRLVQHGAALGFKEQVPAFDHREHIHGDEAAQDHGAVGRAVLQLQAEMAQDAAKLTL